jgi:hypothetical protein
VVQPFQNVQALVQPALTVARGEPDAGFLIPVVVAENLEALHPPTPREWLTEIVDAIGRIGHDLGNAAAQHHTLRIAEMEQRRIQRRPSDIVEVGIYSGRGRRGRWP